MHQLTVNKADVRSEAALGEFRKEKAFSWAAQERARSPQEELTEDIRDELGES